MSMFFVTGASRGFGLEVTREALSRGHQVVATARRAEAVVAALPDAGERLLPVSLDVTDERQVAAAVDEALERFGAVDVLVNNAGRGMLGAVEEVSDAEARATFDVNVFGLLAVTRAVLPGMRARRSGTVVNISSSGGFVGRAGFGVYCATKFAVEGLSEALRGELAPLGIGVVAVEPGGFRTDFLDGSSLGTAVQVVGDYDATAGAVRTWAQQTNHAQPGDPAKAAAVIVDLAETADPDRLPERLQLGADCVDLVADKLARATAEQEAWRAVSTSTDHDDAGRTGRAR